MLVLLLVLLLVGVCLPAAPRCVGAESHGPAAAATRDYGVPKAPPATPRHGYPQRGIMSEQTPEPSEASALTAFASPLAEGGEDRSPGAADISFQVPLFLACCSLLR
ncbi:MAG: hypothetical protein U0793_23600 [Gemmataceae bacterium]|mgnify:CR=1 FL=1